MDSGLLPGALGPQDPPPLVRVAGMTLPGCWRGLGQPASGPGPGLGTGRAEGGVCRLWRRRGLTERGRRRAAAARARDTEMLDGRQLLGHCPALATRPAVNLKGPQDIVTGAADRAGAQAGVLRSAKLPQQKLPPVFRAQGGRAACLRDD